MSWVRALLLVPALVLAGCATTGEPDLSSEQATRAAEANTQLAVQYLREGELQQGLRKALKAIEQNDESAGAHMVAGELYSRLDDDAEAQRYFREAVRLEPDNASALNNYGRFLCDQGDTEEAFELFDRAADNPLYDRPEVPLTNAGLCARRNDDVETAERYFRRALQRNGSFPRALLNLAEIRLDEGDTLSARAFYERYRDAVDRQSPASLWVGIRLAAALDDQDRLASYSLLLRQRYPESDEAARLLEWERDGRL